MGTAVVLLSSTEHQLSGKTKEEQSKTKKLHRCVPTTTTRATLVTFSKKVRVRKIARLIDMNSQDKHATYYSHDEMVQTRNMLRATIRVINEDYQQQQGSKRNTTTKREMDDPTQTLTQKIENNITSENEKEQQESESLFCAAYNDKNCDCCRPIIQNNNKNNNDCSDDEDDDDHGQNESNRKNSEDHKYQWQDTTFCLRGLEVEFPTGKQRRRRNKTIARDMVFEEQRYYNTKTQYNKTSTPTTTTTRNGNKNNDTKGQQQELEEEREKKDGKVKVEIEIEEDPVLA